MDDSGFPADRQTEEQSYWPTVLYIGGIFGMAGFLINITLGYMQIGSEPTGSILSPVMMGSVVICLATSIGGLAAVWYFAKHVTPHMKLGRGALIGFLTGGVIVVVSSILNEVWTVLDPGYTERLLESIVESVEAMNLPADTRQEMIDQIAAGVNPSFFQQLVAGIPVTGFLNMLTGMLGIKLFVAKDEDTL